MTYIDILFTYVYICLQMWITTYTYIYLDLLEVTFYGRLMTWTTWHSTMLLPRIPGLLSPDVNGMGEAERRALKCWRFCLMEVKTVPSLNESHQQIRQHKATFVIFGLYLSHYQTQHMWTRIWVAKPAAGHWLQGPNCNVLAMYPMYSEIGPCHRRDVAWMVSITSGNGRPGFRTRTSVLMTPFSMRILGASNTPKNVIILNFDDLCYFFWCSCVFVMVFRVLSCLSSFPGGVGEAKATKPPPQARWRQRT